MAQPRPRFVRKGGYVGIYEPAEITAYKEAIALIGRRAVPGVLPYWDRTVPLSLTLRFDFPLPQKVMKAERARRLMRGWHVLRPDLDNLSKAVMDALTGIWWERDEQIAELVVSKMWTSEEGRVKALVSVLRDYEGSSES
jgi:Holliday junction resolvase RusA-like endonuclease